MMDLCGNPLMRNIRRLDKLVDELARGKPMEKIRYYSNLRFE